MSVSDAGALMQPLLTRIRPFVRTKRFAASDMRSGESRIHSSVVFYPALTSCVPASPLSSSGSRILVTLIHLLKKGEYGLAAVCNVSVVDSATGWHAASADPHYGMLLKRRAVELPLPSLLSVSESWS